jgi:hypothetical protein
LTMVVSRTAIKIASAAVNDAAYLYGMFTNSP